MRERDVPINPTLPLVMLEDSDAVRETEDIARRAIVLLGVLAVGHEVPQSEVVDWLQAEGLWEAVSAAEKNLFGESDPPRQAIIDATWRAETLWVLLWSLGKVEELKYPTELCDLQILQDALPRIGQPTRAFIASATRRSDSVVLDATDMTYRIHWAIRDAQLKEEPAPAELNAGVVVERHYALNWLVYYADDWDDITTDT